MPSPKFDIRISGRRPKRSDKAPCTGENTNCINAQAVPNTPKICAARAVSPPRKSTTSRGRTGMIMPSASMSSSTVMKTKTKAGARRAGAAGDGALAGGISLMGERSSVGTHRWAFMGGRAALLPFRIRILLLAQGQPDGGAGQIEALAQIVDQIALIGVRHRVGPAQEQHEARRPAFRLGDVIEPDAAARDRRRRMRLDDRGEPAVERGGRYAPVPD